MKKIVLAAFTTVLILGSNPPAFSHGGGLDWQGGHNCRTGSCAGTYHCHQARAGICANNSGSTTKKSKSTKKW